MDGKGKIRATVVFKKPFDLFDCKIIITDYEKNASQKVKINSKF